MRFYDSDTVRAALSVGRATYVLREALLDGVDPALDIPRTGEDVGEGKQLLTMPSASRDHAGVKLLTVHRGNAERGLPTIQGVYVLYDGDTLAPTAILDGPAVTEIRTPALSFAGILEIVRRRRENARVLREASGPVTLRVAIVGGGPQAVGHASGVMELFGGEDDGDVELTFVVRTEQEIDCPVPHEVATELPEGADLIICATSASEPVIADADVTDHAVVVAMGAHHPERREVPGELVARSSVIVEDPRVAREECGDIALAIKEGNLEDGAWSTLRDVVVEPGLAAEIADASGPVVYKTAGQGWEDLACAVEIVARADAAADAEQGGAAGE
ncbi:ornithine cyclodeaminase family protein [Corynebacterium sp. 335C]